MSSLLDPALLAKVAVYVISINIALGALKKILDVIDPTEEQKQASKFYQVVDKIVTVFQKLTDIVSANLPH